MLVIILVRQPHNFFVKSAETSGLIVRILLVVGYLCPPHVGIAKLNRYANHSAADGLPANADSCSPAR
jgi:hypothetical protein